MPSALSANLQRPALEAVLVTLTAAVLTLVALGPVMDAGFVYDDHRQIEDNQLIRQPARLAEALTTDVWAFKGQRDEPWSAYWRPVFVLWLAGCRAVFGLDGTVGWRLANLALHALVTGLAWLLLRRLGAGRGLAWATALVFAVHPVHVESVGWISGSPDLLAGLFGLAGILLVVRGADGGSSGAAAAGWLCIGLALLAKEAAIGLPLMVATALWLRPAGEAATRWSRRREVVALAVIPGVGLSVAYLAMRVAVLGGLAPPPPVVMSAGELVVTAIRVLGFYLHQSLLPLAVAPAYGLRAAAGSSTALLAPVAGPLLVLGVAALLWCLVARRSPAAAFGGVLFLVALAPALKVDAFLPDHIVHDRYLYLAVLGPVVTVAVAAAGLLRRLPVGTAPRAAAAVATAAVLAGCVLLSRRAAACWTDDVALWQCSVASDPSSAYNHAQLAHALFEAGRSDEARGEADAALAIAPATTALVVRADLALADGRPAAAIPDLRTIVEHLPESFAAWERLAVAYQALGDLSAAEQALETARRKVPWRVCTATTDLAVVLVLQGRPDEALAQLATVLDSEENTRVCRMAPYYAARLELRRGDTVRARRLLEGYLVRSAVDTGADSLEQRSRARRLLASLEAGSSP